MAILMRMDWDGITPENYDEVRKLVDWEGDQPPGGMSHVAAFDDQGMHVNDTWASAEQFDTFMTTRLAPALAQVGLAGEPRVTIIEAHAVYIAGVTH